MADQLHTVSLSFLVDDLQVRRGGVGANIAFGLASLGLNPILVAAVGMTSPTTDRGWIVMVSTRPVQESEVAHTARFVCTTDSAHNPPPSTGGR